ncbi:cation:dicarboxylase symporter family transporter [Geodermatophilus sp. YIM 151500]|uniref:cation:dicarboxylate symporter family transporter n=1 Tax=Geodermatophilus sp. YIM 151500 TaxID=2984531 RepID=UPI0021E515D9|nr:cation:dicarboxylase symporter family transporter [Geodermatophilus sp. YIM 151500]MCV2490031.1 cation:dicarboxylase symporter family transporter [Geodermatophilus sp. YIM 151500]
MASPSTGAPRPDVAKRRDRTHWLYLSVIAAVVLGIAVGFLFPEFATSLKWLGTAFVALIKMLIAPVIFCTIVLGIGSIRQAAKVGRVGGMALGYFLLMSTVALAIGLVVGNVIDPGSGLQLSEDLRGRGSELAGQAEEGGGTTEFLLGVIPTTLVSALTDGSVLQALLVALLAGFAIQAMGRSGEPILRGIGHFQRLVFRVLAMIMWVAPVGAFGAIAAVVGETGIDALKSLAVIMLGFYATCVLFVVVVLGVLLKLATGINVFSLLRYLGREFLLIVSTSSSETALPRLIAKMEHAGVSKPVAGIVVPTGYSFNLDGTAIYLTMASLFIASALGDPLTLGEQIGLLVFMIVASKGAAGVTGAGLATLAGGLSAHRPDLLDGVGLIVGIDRFMSEARALTNFAGNAVATMLIATWTRELDREQLTAVLAGQRPFDESTMVDAHGDADLPADAELPSVATDAGPGQRDADAGLRELAEQSAR